MKLNLRKKNYINILIKLIIILIIVLIILNIINLYNNQKNRYQHKINEIAKKYGAVGLTTIFIDDGKIKFDFSYGDAIKNEIPMTIDTKIRLASISKIYVALATMISVEEGTMTLDEDISKYWGFEMGVHSKEDVITPRSILTHTSSIKDLKDVSNTSYKNMEYLLKSGNGINNLISGDIKNYHYNNYAFYVLGMTIELANKKCLDDILSERIFKPLEIDASFYAGDLKDTSKIATIYKSNGDIGLSTKISKMLHKKGIATNGSTFAGGLTTSATDLAKIITLIANNGIYNNTRYLYEDSIKELEYHENNNLGNFWQCQPLFYRENMYNQEEFYYHTGSAYGAYNFVGYNPKTKQGIVVLSTGAKEKKDEYEVYSICSDIIKMFLTYNL